MNRNASTLSLVAVGGLVLGTLWSGCSRPKAGTTPMATVVNYTESGTQNAKAGRVTEAVVDFNRAIAINPTAPEPYIGLAVLYESANRPDLAVETLEQLQAANPTAQHLGCRMAEAYLGAEDLKAARVTGEKAVAQEPDCVRAHSVYGLTLLRFRYWDSAGEMLRKAMRLAPDDVEIGMVLVDLYMQQAVYAKATELGEQLLAKAPNSARLHYKLGWGYSRQPQRGDITQRAITHLQKAIEIAPKWFEPYAELGRLYKSLGRNDEAITTFEQAWKLNNSVSGVAYNLAVLWRQKGDRRGDAMDRQYKQIMQEMERFTAMRRDYNTDASKADNTMALAEAEGRSGAHGAALHRLRKLLVVDPDNLPALQLYVRLDQEIRAKYPEYLRPGPGIGAPGM